jgi:hypothetical protein
METTKAFLAPAQSLMDIRRAREKAKLSTYPVFLETSPVRSSDAGTEGIVYISLATLTTRQVFASTSTSTKPSPLC